MPVNTVGSNFLWFKDLLFWTGGEKKKQKSIILLQSPGEPNLPFSLTLMRQQSIPKAQMTFF